MDSSDRYFTLERDSVMFPEWVPDGMVDVTDEIAALRAERERGLAAYDETVALLGAANGRAADAMAEVERMRPLVDAALAWQTGEGDPDPNDGPHYGLTPTERTLSNAVDAFRAAQQETTDAKS